MSCSPSLPCNSHPPESGQLLSHQCWAVSWTARSNLQPPLKAQAFPLTHRQMSSFPLLSKHLVFLSITQQSRCYESLLASTFSLHTAMSFLPPLSLCQLPLMELTSLLLQTLHSSPAAHTSVSKHTEPLKKVHLKLEDDYIVCTGAGEYINPVGYLHCLCLS